MEFLSDLNINFDDVAFHFQFAIFGISKCGGVLTVRLTLTFSYMEGVPFADFAYRNIIFCLLLGPNGSLLWSGNEHDIVSAKNLDEHFGVPLKNVAKCDGHV